MIWKRKMREAFQTKRSARIIAVLTGAVIAVAAAGYLFFHNPYVGKQQKQHAQQPGKRLGDGGSRVAPEGDEDERSKDLDDKLHGAGDQRNGLVVDSLEGHAERQQDT